VTAGDDQPLKFAVTVVNERTGMRYVVVVELSKDERDEAVQAQSACPFEMRGDENYWPPLANFYASNRAVAGLPDTEPWSVPLSEITRVTVH
jgi:hypothetical protein